MLATEEVAGGPEEHLVWQEKADTICHQGSPGRNSKGSERCQRRNKGIEGPCQQNMLCGQQQKVKG